MTDRAQLVALFGENQLFTADRALLRAAGVASDDIETLCSTGLPLDVLGFFTISRLGDHPAMGVVRAPTPTGEDTSMLILGIATPGQSLFGLDIRGRDVLQLELSDGAPVHSEPVNSTLPAFVEFLYRFALRRRELAGCQVEQARPYTERLLTELRERDPEALADGRLWQLVFELTELEEEERGGVPVQGSLAAIQGALSELAPDGDTPYTWVPEVGTQSGLRTIRAYPMDGHWLLVTYGFSDVHGDRGASSGDLAGTPRPTDQPSGLGFEVTLTVGRADGRQPSQQAPGEQGGSAQGPPFWALDLLRRLGEHVFGKQRPLTDGDRVDLRHPLDQQRRDMTAVAFASDPRLATLRTPSGQVEFLAALGITTAELTYVKRADTRTVVDEVATRYGGLLMTDPDRSEVPLPQATGGIRGLLGRLRR